MKKLMRRCIFVLIIILISGCGLANVKRTLTLPDGQVYTADMRVDDLISFKDGKNEITFDGRGRPGLIEQILGLLLLNMPDVTIGAR